MVRHFQSNVEFAEKVSFGNLTRFPSVPPVMTHLPGLGQLPGLRHLPGVAQLPGPAARFVMAPPRGNTCLPAIGSVPAPGLEVCSDAAMFPSGSTDVSPEALLVIGGVLGRRCDASAAWDIRGRCLDQPRAGVGESLRAVRAEVRWRVPAVWAAVRGAGPGRGFALVFGAVPDRWPARLTRAHSTEPRGLGPCALKGIRLSRSQRQQMGGCVSGRVLRRCRDGYPASASAWEWR